MKPLIAILSLLSLVGCTPRKQIGAHDIFAALAAGRYRLIDLSHEYFEGMPALVLPPSAPQMPRRGTLLSWIEKNEQATSDATIPISPVRGAGKRA